MTRKIKPKEHRSPSRVSLLMLAPKRVGAAEFKARCLELMHEVERLGTEIVITKHRKPVARLVPVQSKSTGILGCLKGAIVKEVDILSPIDVEWTADEANLT
jgi:prevent-host-death family protein